MKRHYVVFITGVFWGYQASFAQVSDKTPGNQPFSIEGSMGVHTSFYSSSGIDPRKTNFSWYLTGTPIFKIYDVTIPLNLIIGEQQRSFRQSFDQFGITPTYKWIKLFLGYSNVTWSPFTWAGQTLLGAGIEITPAKFRFGFLYGRLNRPVPEDTLSRELQTPAFRRRGFAVKIGYGTSLNYMDLIFVKAKDDSNSIAHVPVKTIVLPAENAVLGITLRQRLGKYFQWDLDAAVSGYTSDLRSMPVSGTDSSTISQYRWLLDVNSSTQYYTALQSEIKFSLKNFKIKLAYRRVDPDFKSMGTYYFQSDVENITLGSSLGLIKNRLRLEATVGRQQDNLLNKKTYTSTRLIGSGSIVLNLKKYFGLTMLYSNYSSSQGKGIRTPTDSIRQSYNAQNISIMPRFFYVSPAISHLILVTYNRQWLDDHNKSTEFYTQYLSDNLNACYFLSFPKKSLTLTITCMLNILKLDTNQTMITGFSAAGSKSFLKNRFQINLMANYSNRKNNRVRVTDIVNITLGATCRITKHHGITATMHYLNNAARFIRYPSFSEELAELGYTYTF